jgi:2-polyprenyl-3-methyl-5-hydroxy-6-metoxy-1,4-benzoquinol methylase
VLELTEYLGRPEAAVRASLSDAAQRFSDEWRREVRDAGNQQALIQFYNESETEIFDLVQWHATDPIHYRTLVCLDIASRRQGRAFLDYGSGIGSDAIVFASAGFEVTLADVSSPLLAFAQWRCERRGFHVNAIDLKRQPLPPRAFDVTTCFDVLEHVVKPFGTLVRIRKAMASDGLLFLHAPFGVDDQRPMHVIHEDVISYRMRSAGFSWRGDLETAFPSWLWQPRVYESIPDRLIDRVAYYISDVLLPPRVASVLGGVYKTALRRTPS